MILLLISTFALATDWGFSDGVNALDTGAKFGDPAQCISCHERIGAQWAQSGHALAHTNPWYQEGLRDEPVTFCLNCHSPQPEQVAEAKSLLSWIRSGELDARPETPLANHGVTCAACHVREGRIQSPNGDVGPHGAQLATDLRDPRFCAGCHEFNIPEFDDHQLSLTDEPMQSTWTEWTSYRDNGGEGTCQSCHMPRGKHTFAGAHDVEFLRSSLQVDWLRSPRQLVLHSVRVGHALPTGDLFRNLTLELQDTVGSWTVLHRIGRQFETQIDPKTGEIHKMTVANTSLKPGERRLIDLPPGAWTAWRVRYHYGSEEDERRGVLTEAQLYQTLWTGTVQ